MSVQQISVFLENKPGTLKKMTGVLKLFLSTAQGRIANVSAEISAVLHITLPIAFP